MTNRQAAFRQPHDPGRLCLIDHAVLAANREGRDWRAVPALRGRMQYLRVLARAQWRERLGAAKK